MWKITDHACRVCFGRVLESTDRKNPQARCADCGASGQQGHDVCACGVMLYTKVNAGLRCLKNPEITIDCPAEIVVSYVGNPDKVDRKPLGPVKLKEGLWGLFDDA